MECPQAPENVKPGPPLPVEALNQLAYLGVYIFRDVAALVKTIRALRHHYVFYGNRGSGGEVRRWPTALLIVPSALRKP